MTDIPKFHQFMRPLLEVLQERGELPRNDAIEAVVQKVGLTAEQMSVSQESNGKSLARGHLARQKLEKIRLEAIRLTQQLEKTGPRSFGSPRT